MLPVGVFSRAASSYTNIVFADTASQRTNSPPPDPGVTILLSVATPLGTCKFPFDLNEAKVSAESLGIVNHIPFCLTFFLFPPIPFSYFTFMSSLYHHLGISISASPSCLQDSLLKGG